MKSRGIVLAVAALFLLAFSLHAQTLQQTLTQSTPEARQQLTKKLQEYRANKDGHREALTLLQIGMADAGLGDVTGARSNLTQAVEKMRAQKDPVGTWMALVLLSQVEVAAGRPAEALPHVERALAVLNDARTSAAPLSFKTLVAFGAVFPPDVSKLLEGPNAGALTSLMVRYSLEPMTHDIYGSVLTDVGQLDKAESELKAAAAGAIYSQGMYDFSIQSHFGDLRFRQKRYDEARTHYVKALNASSAAATLLPMGDGQQIQGGIYNRLVRLETVMGRPEEAKRWAEKARELGRKQPRGR